MTEASTDPRLIELAARVARDNGWDERLQNLSSDDWERLLGLVAARAQDAQVGLPAGWQDALAAYRDRESLRADTDDTKLAEQGEVFGREDDA